MQQFCGEKELGFLLTLYEIPMIESALDILLDIFTYLFQFRQDKIVLKINIRKKPVELSGLGKRIPKNLMAGI